MFPNALPTKPSRTISYPSTVQQQSRGRLQIASTVTPLHDFKVLFKIHTQTLQVLAENSEDRFVLMSSATYSEYRNISLSNDQFLFQHDLIR